MNRHEVVIYAGNLIHMFVWIYVAIGWCLPYARYHVLFIVSILLPIIYVVQSMPCHFLIYGKLKYIQKYRSFFTTSQGYQFGSVDQKVIQNISQALQWDRKELEDLFRVMKKYELDLQVPKIIEYGRSVFEGRSFENPFSPQGMIVVAYIINVIALLWLYRKSTKCN